LPEVRQCEALDSVLGLRRSREWREIVWWVFVLAFQFAIFRRRMLRRRLRLPLTLTQTTNLYRTVSLLC
jgi:hypothetical protein